MAENISLKLTGAALGLIEGDSTVTSLERENQIEVTSFGSGLRSAFEAGTGLATGRRYHEPFTFTKALDRSTPRLHEALVRNDSLHGEFRWFRPNPNGDGTTQHCMTLKFTGARITAVRMHLPDTTRADTMTLRPYEEVDLVFTTIEWDWKPGGVVANDEWIASR